MPNVEQIIERMMARGQFDTEAQLCRALGITQSSLVKAKRKGRLSERLILKFALAYDVPVKWLLMGGPQKAIETQQRARNHEIERTRLQELVEEIYRAGEEPLREMLMTRVKELAMITKLLWARRPESQRRGVDAELEVGHLLQGLPPGYGTFHNVVIEGFAIDSLVIGPTGIFTIETRSDRGMVKVRGEALLLNGQPYRRSILLRTRSAADALQELLHRTTGKPSLVQPILCFPDASVEISRPMMGITVSDRAFLNEAITRHQGRSLSEHEIDNLRHVVMHQARSRRSTRPRRSSG